MTASRIRVAVVGVGDFGRNHVRVYRDLPGAELIGIVDANADRARAVATEYSTEIIPNVDALVGRVDAVSIAVPTAEHARIAAALMQKGIDVLVEKPLAQCLTGADELIAVARQSRRILQVGHLERFNPAIIAARKILGRPLFFEVHRLGVFSARSLDIDVIFDVMIHDLDILLSLVREPVTDVRAVGIPVVSDKVDIAHARLEFSGGAVANVTASRVSTERVRKMRFFQEKEYVSLDYTRQDALRVSVRQPGAEPDFAFEKLSTVPQEPLRAELDAFLTSVRTRQAPEVDGVAGRNALELAGRVAQSIQDHGRRVQLGVFVSPSASQ